MNVMSSYHLCFRSSLSLVCHVEMNGLDEINEEICVVWCSAIVGYGMIWDFWKSF